VEDATLASGLMARDDAVIEIFWRVYFEKLYPICAYILGDGPDALDATVDLMVDFIESHVDRLAKPESLYSYLRLMAVRRSLRLRDRRQKTIEFKEGDHAGVNSSMEEVVWAGQLMPLLDECLGSVTLKAQKALRLKYGNKISNEQIGRHIGGSKQYIGRLIRDALKALRLCIEHKGTNEDPAQSGGAS
jgi:RNA polymerase sigma factor (sigma-70 family)